MRTFARRSPHCAASLLALTGLMVSGAAEAGSIRFFGNGANDIDRVKIRIDDPANNNPGPPADIGAGNFTIEFWIKGAAADNTNTVRCGARSMAGSMATSFSIATVSTCRVLSGFHWAVDASPSA